MNKVLVLTLVMVLVVPTILASDRTDTYISLFALNSTNGSEAIADFSGGENYTLAPPENETWIISRLMVHIEDDKDWDATKYGKDIVLTNGITIQHLRNNVLTNLTNHHPIKSTAQWGIFCYDVMIYDTRLGTDFVNVRWTFQKAGTYLKLDGSKGDEIRVVLTDDFTGLDHHHFLFQGYKLETQGDNMYQAIAIGITLFAILFIVIGVYLFKKREE